MTANNYIVRIFREKFAADISEQDEINLSELFRKEIFAKKEVIFQHGDANTRHYFIEHGLVRLYIIDKNGREFNVEFAKENQILGDLISPAPTSFYLETIEPTTAYSISDVAIKALMKELNFKENADSSNIVQKSYVKVQQRLVNMLANSAEDNYTEFRDRNPDLIQRLPQYHIAAYLGVSAEFLSRTIAKAVKK